MIISRTPYRVSLFGGGTDHPEHYREHGGAVIGFALNRYCHLSVRRLPPFFGHRHRVVWSQVETVGSTAEIRHPAVRAALTEFADLIGEEGLEIHHDGDLPARSGLGSSSSFMVGLVNALDALYVGSSPSPSLLARTATRLEREGVGDVVGDQDQLFAAFGGFMRFDFANHTSVRHVSIPDDRLRDLLDHLLLVYTGTSRDGTALARAQVARADANLTQLNELHTLVAAAERVLVDPNRSLEQLGHLLHASWLLKRTLADGVTTDAVDAGYARARANGALGGKLMGAGGGGFMLLYAPPDAHARVLASFPPGAVPVPIGISHEGSRIVLNNGTQR